jgi:PRC-barrel domain
MAEPRAAKCTDIVPAKKTVIGSKVVNAQNEDLGKIKDLVLDAGPGRIAYAVLSFAGFLGMGDKYFAIPWNAFHFNLKENRPVLNVDKETAAECSGFRQCQLAELCRFDLGKQHLQALWLHPLLG